MKTAKQLTAQTLDRTPSDPTADPPRQTMIGTTREELLAIFGSTQPLNDKAAEIKAGAENASPNSELAVVREDLLSAMGVDWQSHDEAKASAPVAEPVSPAAAHAASDAGEE